jgi:hypothetical protein
MTVTYREDEAIDGLEQTLELIISGVEPAPTCIQYIMER